MATKAFKGISFTLPQKNRLKVAVQTDVMCGNAWYEREGEARVGVFWKEVSRS